VRCLNILYNLRRNPHCWCLDCVALETPLPNDEWMLEQLGCRPPLLWIPLETMPQKVVNVDRQKGQDDGHVGGAPNSVHDLAQVLHIIPRRPPGRHFEHRAPKRPNVGRGAL
jgi:hypothetical protein